MESEFGAFLTDLKKLRQAIRREDYQRISKKTIKDCAQQLASKWFSVVAKDATEKYTFSTTVIEAYSSKFSHLLKLAESNNLKSSYVATLDGILRKFRDDLILPLQRNEVQLNNNSLFAKFVSNLSDSDESAYFHEALNCAQHGFLRAAAVLGWSAAIDRIHRVIEQGGFAKFNTVSAQMAAQTKGRYKNFNQKQNVASLGELREVFDTTILWIIDGMAMIDSNQHTRLRTCFDMRCQCAHPGEAPVTEYNLMSFFSDIQKIVLENEVFKIPASVTS